MAIGSFGEGFVEGFNATARTLDERKRTAIAERADTRAQQEWEQKLQDLKDNHADIASVSSTLQNDTDAMAKAQRDAAAATAAAPAQGMQPPSPAPTDGSAVSAAAAPPDASTTPPTRTAAITPPGVGDPGGPPKLNLDAQGMTPQNLAAIAANVSKERNIPLQQAMSLVTSAMSSNGPAPPPEAAGLTPNAQQVAYTSAAPTPAVAAGLAQASPPPPEPAPPPAAAAPPPGPPAPAAEADQVPPTPAAPAKAPTLKEMIDAARKTTAKVTPTIVRILMRSNPVEGAKLALNFTNEAVQDRMTKTITLASLMKSSPTDPAVEPLLQEIYPGYVPNSFVAHPPDADGNTSGRLQQKMPDGSVATVGVFPAFINHMLTQALSPMQILEQDRLAQESKLKEREFQSQDKSRLAAEKLGIDTLSETSRYHREEAGERAARTEQMHETAGYYREAKEAQIEQKKQTAKTAAETGAVNTAYKILGIGPTTPADDPARIEGGKSLGWARSVLEENNLPLDSANLSRVLPYVVGIRSGDVSSIRVKPSEPGQYYLDTGVGPPLKMPYVSPDIRARIEAAQAKLPKVPPPPPQTPGGLQPPSGVRAMSAGSQFVQ